MNLKDPLVSDVLLNAIPVIPYQPDGIFNFFAGCARLVYEVVNLRFLISRNTHAIRFTSKLFVVWHTIAFAYCSSYYAICLFFTWILVLESRLLHRASFIV
jgi:hypothetical protein